jgi:hypothetical protein
MAKQVQINNVIDKRIKFGRINAIAAISSCCKAGKQLKREEIAQLPFFTITSS